MPTYRAPRGAADILPADEPYWDRVRETARRVAGSFGYRAIETPMFEATGLFVRGVGAGTDIVEKEMYSFEDRGGDSLTLRPEGTAGVCRAYIQHGMHALPQPVRLFYVAPAFRYERPQAGRFRQHWQFGAEAIGEADPLIDVEVIHLAWTYLGELGLRDLTLHLNSIGDRESRREYLAALVDYYRPRAQDVCGDCRVRLERNALRLLDCKQASCQPLIAAAPQIAGYLDGDSADHFAAVERYLAAVEIPYQIDHRLVRGLDYYTRTVFEIFPAQEGAQSAVAAGGRYDGLIEELGGRPTPGVGFGSGIERAVLGLREQAPLAGRRLDVFVAPLGESARAAGLRLASSLRRSGLTVQLAAGQRSLKALLRAAGAASAAWAAIIGDDEVAAGTVALKDLTTGEQVALPAEEAAARMAGGGAR